MLFGIWGLGLGYLSINIRSFFQMEGWGIVEKNSTSRNYHNGQCWYFFIKTLLSYFVHKRGVGSILQTLLGTLLLFEFLLHDGLVMVLLILNIGNLGEPYRIGNVKQVYNVVSGPSHNKSKKSDRTSSKLFRNKDWKEQSDHKTTSSMRFLESQRRSQRLGCSKIRLHVTQNSKSEKK